MNATFDAVVGQEPVNLREVKIPAGVRVTREKPRNGRGGRAIRGRVVPDNKEMVEWLDTSTPGWRTITYGGTNKRIGERWIIFMTSQQAALFKLFWT